jgi:Ser/Thr protein kinase RdoA (MazF antagonist)
VTAILDFEFVTQDARMIDITVMLARLIGSLPPARACVRAVPLPVEGLSAEVWRAAAAEEDDQHWERIDAFVGGYGSVAHLTPEEIALLPLCLRLRRMITFLHRMAQHWDGQASLADGTSMSRSASRRFVCDAWAPSLALVCL